MSEKVFWKSSTKDPDNIDLEELLLDNTPKREERKTRPSSARKIRVRSGSAKRIIIGNKPPIQAKKPIEASDEMSKQEMMQIIESQKREIKYLQEKVTGLEQDKDQMVDNFQLSSGVLLERLKDLEQFKQQVEINQILPSLGLGQSNGISEEQRSHFMPREQLERPQTAQVLSKISGKTAMGSDGELQLEKMACPNCSKEYESAEMAAHTVQCYRNSTKCKVCGKVILKDKKKEHLNRWRSLELMLEAIANDRDEQVSLHFDHGIDCNMQFKSKEKPSPQRNKMVLPVPDATNQSREDWTPMHFAAESGSLNVILAMVSRGAGIDPTDTFERTPLMIAIENNKSAVARSLIELGADIELVDIYGKTPLMYACKVASAEIVELLIKCKANIQVVNKVGESAVTMAQKSGIQEIMMILVKSGASIRPSSRARPPLPLSK